MDKGRVSWIDCAKGIAAVLMILGHTWFTESLKAFFYTFHMPLFFILSGYTFRFEKNINTRSFFAKRIKPIVAYYILFAALNIAWKGIKAVLSTEFSISSICKDLVGIVVNIRGAEYGPGLWFLTAFVSGYILFYFIFRRVRSVISLQIVLAVSLIICWGAYMHFLGVRLPWGIDVAPLIAFMLWIGYSAREYGLLTKLFGDKLKIVCVGIVFIVGFIANYYLGEQSRVDIWSNNYGNYCLFLINAVTGTSLLCCVASRITSNKLNYLGKNSVFVYGLHGIPNEILMLLASKILSNAIKNPFIEFVVGIVITCLVLCCVVIGIKSYGIFKNRVIKSGL